MGDSDSNDYSGKSGSNSPGLDITGKIVIMVMMFLFFTVLLVLFLHLFLKCLSYHHHGRNDEPQRQSWGRRPRFVFAASPRPGSTAAIRCSLEPSVMKSIPALVFNSKDFKELECAVCISEVIDREKVRILPKCNHGFHMDCIDMWFQSNSTCPICRNPVSKQPTQFKTTELVAEENSAAAVFLTNILIWGNQGELSNLSLNSEQNSQASTPVSSKPNPSSSSPTSSLSHEGTDGALAIDIPRQIEEEDGDETAKKSPIIKRLVSLKRFLSPGTTTTTRVNSCTSTSSSSDDPEQQTGPEQN